MRNTIKRNFAYYFALYFDSEVLHSREFPTFHRYISVLNANTGKTSAAIQLNILHYQSTD